MAKRLSGKEKDLVAYYPLDGIKYDGATREVVDLAGGNHGIITGAIAVQTIRYQSARTL